MIKDEHVARLDGLLEKYNADLPILNIGAPFWGLVLGLSVAWLLERPDFSIERDPPAR